MIHNVQPGECLSSIADSYGFRDWRTIYDHESNTSFRKKRQDPNVILPGDELFIPDLLHRTEECATGKTHTFRVKMPSASLRVILKDHDGTPFAGKKFVVKVGSREIHGTTGKDGLLEVPIHSRETTAVLSAWLYEDDDPEYPDVEYELELGHLDPVESIMGIQARLQNLGFRCEVDGVAGDETAAAIRGFREKHGIPSEGDDLIDDTLRAKLFELHEGG